MFVDSHCHLDFPCFNAQREQLLLQLQQQKIIKLIIPATQASGWDRLERLSDTNPQLYYSLGIHPHFLNSFKELDLKVLRQKLVSAGNKCVALGEIGLDKLAKTEQSLQEYVFVEQLQIAQQLKLPVILHCVKKQSRIIELLKEKKFTQGGVYHAFSGSVEVANEFIKLGFKLGIGGVITYPNSKKTRQTITQLPIESLLLETDAPDMPIYQQQERNNSPLNIIPIFNSLCALRSESTSQLAKQLYNNACNIFPLSND